MGGETKILKRVGQAGARGGCLKKEGDWNPLTNYDYTNSNLYRCWMYLFNWRFSPVGLFDILYLARDSLLKHLCCYFLLFLGRLLASLLCICVCVCTQLRTGSNNNIKTSSYSMKKYQKLSYEFFWYQHRKLFSNLVQVNNL